MKTLIFNEHELNMIKKHNCICVASAEDVLKRTNCSFDDIEAINEHYENHKWGSNADRKYRKAAINKAINKLAANPSQFITL